MSRSEVTYVMQRAEVRDPEVWVDIATITVPAKTKRATVIGKALVQAGFMPTADEPLRVRVLDARSAHVTTVVLKQPEPQLEMT